MNIKDKVKKLLALSMSDNENEAQAALLKAQKLMAEHKLDLADFKEKLEIENRKTGITCTKQSNPWRIGLSTIIASNYCCVSYWTRRHRAKTCEIVFGGLSEDLDVCEAAYKYAVDHIDIWIKNYRKTEWRYTNKFMRSIENGYADGFVCGLNLRLNEQREKHIEEWGLVLVTPMEVKSITEKMESEDFKYSHNPGLEKWDEGYRDGSNLQMNDRIMG